MRGATAAPQYGQRWLRPERVVADSQGCPTAAAGCEPCHSKGKCHVRMCLLCCVVMSGRYYHHNGGARGALVCGPAAAARCTAANVFRHVTCRTLRRHSPCLELATPFQPAYPRQMQKRTATPVCQLRQLAFTLVPLPRILAPKLAHFTSLFRVGGDPCNRPVDRPSLPHCLTAAAVRAAADFCHLSCGFC